MGSSRVRGCVAGELIGRPSSDGRIFDVAPAWHGVTEPDRDQRDEAYMADASTSLAAPDVTSPPPDHHPELDRAAHRGSGQERRPLSDVELDTGRLIAGLIDGELESRCPTSEVAWFRQALGCTNLKRVWSRRDRVNFELDALAILQLVKQHPEAQVSGVHGDPEPRWMVVDLGDRTLELPTDLWAAFPAGTLFDVPVGIGLDSSGSDRPHLAVIVALPSEHARLLPAVFSAMAEARRDNVHPYMGRTFQVIEDKGGGFTLRGVRTPRVPRDHLILPDEVWTEVDRNVVGLFRHRELLQRLELGTNRGLLLVGPPGTGKTELTRLIAGELAGLATTFFVSTGVMEGDLGKVYDLAAELSPTLVVLEDVDTIAGRRYVNASGGLLDFLSAVDGGASTHDGIVTVATTNDASGIDDAAKRAARFDRIIDVPLPPAVGRRRIWERYLTGLAGDFEMDRLVRASGGGSGADIREIVRHAILESDGEPTTDLLVEFASDRGLGRPTATGHYL